MSYTIKTYAQLRKWARTVTPGEYLVTYEDTGLSEEEIINDGSRCGYDDPTHDQINKWLGERGLCLDTDDTGLIVVTKNHRD